MLTGRSTGGEESLVRGGELSACLGGRWGWGPHPRTPDALPSLPQEKCVNCTRKFRCAQGFQLQVRRGSLSVCQPQAQLCSPRPGERTGWAISFPGRGGRPPQTGGLRPETPCPGLHPAHPFSVRPVCLGPSLALCCPVSHPWTPAVCSPPFTALPCPWPLAEPSCCLSPGHPQEELCLPLRLLLLSGLLLHVCQEDPGLL